MQVLRLSPAVQQMGLFVLNRWQQFPTKKIYLKQTYLNPRVALGLFEFIDAHRAASGSCHCPMETLHRLFGRLILVHSNFSFLASRITLFRLSFAFPSTGVR